VLSEGEGVEGYLDTLCCASYPEPKDAGSKQQAGDGQLDSPGQPPRSCEERARLCGFCVGGP
jgi:hypothetical protein